MKKKTDKITTVAGIVAAISGSVLASGAIEVGSHIFVAISSIGAAALGVLGFFTNKKDNPKDNILP
jgi:hypothetical protein